MTVENTPVPGRRRKNPLIYFWVYSLLRIALMAALFGLLWLFGVRSFLGAAIAVALSVPLSYVLLARPRNAMTAAMMERLNVRQERNASFDEQVAGPDFDGPDDEAVDRAAVDDAAVDDEAPDGEGRTLA